MSGLKEEHGFCPTHYHAVDNLLSGTGIKNITMQVFHSNFPSRYMHNGFVVEYVNFREVGQGRPEIANLFIDGHQLDGYYGGPLLFYDNFAFAPKAIQHNGTQFLIHQINLENFKTRKIGRPFNLILLSKIERNSIHFFSDLDNMNQEMEVW